MSNVLAADSAAGAQRWEAPVFGQLPPPSQLHTAAQLDAMERAAYDEGYASGHAEGYAAGAAEVSAQAQRLRALLEHCSRPLAELDAEVETVLTGLALAAARRLVQRQFEIEPGLLEGTVHEAIAALVTVPRELRVHLHPEDARLLQDQLERPAEVAAWRLIPDVSLARGDCRIAGESGWVDATLATRERALAQALSAEHEAAA